MFLALVKINRLAGALNDLWSVLHEQSFQKESVQYLKASSPSTRQQISIHPLLRTLYEKIMSDEMHSRSVYFVSVFYQFIIEFVWLAFCVIVPNMQRLRCMWSAFRNDPKQKIARNKIVQTVRTVRTERDDCDNFICMHHHEKLWFIRSSHRISNVYIIKLKFILI